MKKKYIISLTIIVLGLLYGLFGLILIDKPLTNVFKYRIIAGVVIVCIDALFPLLFLVGNDFDEKIPGIHLLGFSFFTYPLGAFLFIYLVTWKLALEIIVLIVWTIFFMILLGIKGLLSLHIRDVKRNEKIIENNHDLRDYFDNATLKLKERFLPSVTGKLQELRNDYWHIAPCNTPRAAELDSEIKSGINRLMSASSEEDAMDILERISDYVEERAKCFSK